MISQFPSLLFGHPHNKIYDATIFETCYYVHFFIYCRHLKTLVSISESRRCTKPDIDSAWNMDQSE